ncbi:MAG: hypothetical protein U5K36_14100 [Roseovarius sp.]|nr:hypothetical protein [Roseovarius sp.]
MDTYLLRFMERLPPNGAISVFDRSWYGRVLVERVEGLAPEQRWRHAYGEIRSFEQMLLDDGMRLVKLFFQSAPDVQLQRFEQRLRNPYKRWKLTYEDFRNHEKWDAYVSAVDEMIERTSTEGARWKIIPSNNKRHARIEAINHIVKIMSKDIEIKPFAPNGDVLDAADRILNIDKELIASLRGRTE